MKSGKEKTKQKHHSTQFQTNPIRRKRRRRKGAGGKRGRRRKRRGGGGGQGFTNKVVL